MQAKETSFLKLLQGPNQFRVPIFQRRYSWKEQHCEQLWNDVLDIGKNDEIRSHFLGSIVYIEPGGSQNISAVSEILVIDGQQRLTTLSLLLLALGRAIEKSGREICITPKQISNYYLFNADEEGELRYKQLLTHHDKDTLIQLLENRKLPCNASPRLVENYRFFETKLQNTNFAEVYAGISKLAIVDIALDRRYDDPQLIFESLNSTGLNLSQADLIRNYVLMGQEPSFQNRLYEAYWLPMEQRFGDQYGDSFDRFIRDYLTLKTRQIPRIGGVYERFKVYIEKRIRSEALETIEPIIEDISRYSKHYVRIALDKEEDTELRDCFTDINTLEATVAFPFLLEVYEDYTRKKITKLELVEILRLVESYVFRRAICGIPTNTLNRTFGALMTRVVKSSYLESLKDVFRQLTSTRRYPSNSEFKEALFIKDVYNFSRRGYLLRKLENHGRRELICVTDYTTEHVMPQNPDLSESWQQELGENWQAVQEKYLHTIGNLTLTGYNSKLSDRPFKEKQEIKGGFGDSPLRLNRSLARVERWNEAAIRGRSAKLTEKALKIWIYPQFS